MARESSARGEAPLPPSSHTPRSPGTLSRRPKGSDSGGGGGEGFLLLAEDPPPQDHPLLSAMGGQPSHSGSSRRPGALQTVRAILPVLLLSLLLVVHSISRVLCDSHLRPYLPRAHSFPLRQLTTMKPPAVQGPQGLLAALAACALLAALPHAADGPEQAAFHLAYQPLLVGAAVLWLWASAVALFEQEGIAYATCFSPADQQHLLPAASLEKLAGLLSAAVLASGALYAALCWRGLGGLAVWQPPLLYAALALALLLPGGALQQGPRQLFARTLGRVATPLRPVTWADFLLADVLTSLAKPLSDLLRVACGLLAPQPAGLVAGNKAHLACGAGGWVAGVGLALPFAWRFCQCLRVFWDDRAAVPQLWNALKYATALPAIYCYWQRAVLEEEVWQEQWRTWWLAAALLNTGFSYFWDVERDWEIAWFTAGGSGERAWGVPLPQLRPQLCFGRGFYAWLLASNAALRCAWLHRLHDGARASPGAALLLATLEAFRRFQWLPVRVEVELRKLQAARPELGQLVPPLPPRDGEGAPRGAAAAPKAAALNALL